LAAWQLSAWQLGSLEKLSRKIARMANQAEIKCYFSDLCWKFDVFVPATHAQWQDSKKRQIEHLAEYKTLIDKGVGGEAAAAHKFELTKGLDLLAYYHVACDHFRDKDRSFVLWSKQIYI
jgi:hypothetical protein